MGQNRNNSGQVKEVVACKNSGGQKTSIGKPDIFEFLLQLLNFHNTYFSKDTLRQSLLNNDYLRRNFKYINIRILMYSGISLRRTQHKADTLYKADKDFVVFWSNSVNINLYKADNSTKRSLIYGPNGVRFREIPLQI